MTTLAPTPTPRRDDPAHRAWLAAEAEALFAFFQPSLIAKGGGFANLDERGRPMPEHSERALHETTRMVHCFAIAHLLGRKGADDIVDHGMAAIRTRHHDPRHGGYFWSFDDNGPRERDKLAYGHAFVLLAAASAKCAGHPEADALLADIAEVIETRFWEPQHGASAEEFREDWTPFSGYRGQNANMHLAEALMAAFEATGEREFLTKAESIADLILRRAAADNDWFVPEHFTDRWAVDRDYKGSDMFRPFGVTPGHALEWTRLALQMWELGGRALAWLPEAARALFERAVKEGWDKTRGGLYYTLEWSGAPRVRDRLWWPCCEGIGAATFLAAHDGGERAEDWYTRLWEFADRNFIDHRWGGWRPQLDDALQPVERYFVGKPDLYHAVQACLIPLYPADASLTRGIFNAAAKVR